MKAKELIKILEEDPERIVVLTANSGGNSYSPLGGFSKQYKFKDGELLEEGERGGKKAFVLWPE